MLGLRRSTVDWGVGCAVGLLSAAPLVLFTAAVPSEEVAPTFAVTGAVVFVVVVAVAGIAPPAAPGLWSLRYLLRRDPLTVGALVVAEVLIFKFTAEHESNVLAALPALALSAMVGVSSSSREVCVRPSDPLRWAKARAVVQILASVVATGSLVASVSPADDDLVVHIVTVLLVTATLGLPIGFALALTRSPIARYPAVVTIGRWGNRLPLRTARFLDWAHEVGLLRMAGTAAEFRHERLRDHFRKT